MCLQSICRPRTLNFAFRNNLITTLDECGVNLEVQLLVSFTCLRRMYFAVACQWLNTLQPKFLHDHVEVV